ncbi:hypothetical protein N657DRAFT_564784, partial [Parathielavia appendiculata]
VAAMSNLRLSPAIDRPDSRVSLARSDTTYHSFQDVELFEPGVPSQPAQKPTGCPPPASPSSKAGRGLDRGEMRRQDSGYESIAPRDSFSSRHWSSSSTSLPSYTRQRRTRPSTQRSPKSGPISRRPQHGRHSVSPPGTSRSPRQPQQPVAYFHFPHFTSSDPALVESSMAVELLQNSLDHALRSQTPTPPLPPQTTHYWTSDRTRRLEYAAIDAASKGVRGWVMRHVVPDCFVPENKRRIGFEDDRGSVLRHRLELDTDDSAEKAESALRTRGWRGWFIGMRRRC